MALDFPVGTDFPANGDQIPDGEIYEGFYWDAATGAWKRVCERDKIGDCLDDDADETVCDKLNEIERDIIELEEEIDAIATSRDRGTWEWAFSVNSYLDLLPAGQFYMVQESDLAVVTDYKDCGRIIFHEDDLENDNHVFNTDLIDKVLMLFDRPDDDFIESVITNVEETTGATGKVYVFHVDRRQSEGSPTNAPDADGKYKARLNIFDQPSGGNAGEYVLKIGDTMTGNLKIDISEGGPTDGGASGKEAALTLKGDRTGTTNSVATIMWDNAASSYPGYLTYRSGTSSEQFFKFNQDVQFNDKILSEINTISIKNKIQKDGSDRITFQSGSGDSGKGTILAHRPGNLQRGFTIKGKVAGSSNTAFGDSALYNNTTGSYNAAIGQKAGYYIKGSSNTILGAYLGSSAEENLSNTVIISAGRTQRMRIDENGDTEFYGKVTSESTEASDSDTTLVTKDYVDGLKTIYVDGLGGTTFATVNFILQYSNSSATLTADGGDIAITSNSIVYRKSAAGRVMPELKVGDQVRVVKPNGDVHIRQVTNVDGLFGDFFIVGAAEISSGVSLTVGEFYDFNFMFK